MSATILIDRSDFYKIKTKTVNPSRYLILAEKLKEKTKKIKEEWHNLPKDDKQTLQNLAYELIEPPNKIVSLFLELPVTIFFWVTDKTGQRKNLKVLTEALEELIDTILDCVEHDDISRGEDLANLLEDIAQNPNIGEPVDAADRREWLSGLSDKALKEI